MEFKSLCVKYSCLQMSKACHSVHKITPHDTFKVNNHSNVLSGGRCDYTPDTEYCLKTHNSSH